MPKRIVINVEDITILEELALLIPETHKRNKFLLEVIKRELVQHQDKIKELRELEQFRKRIFQDQH